MSGCIVRNGVLPYVGWRGGSLLKWDLCCSLAVKCRLSFPEFQHFLNLYRYTEAINLVYSRNTFDTAEAHVVAFLPHILLPERFHAIRSFQIRITMPVPPSYPPPSFYTTTMSPEKLEKARKPEHENRTLWNMTWKNLSKMEGLVILKVEVKVDERLQHLWEVEEFDCVRLVTRPKEVRLVLPDVLAERFVGKTGNSNCTVQDWVADRVHDQTISEHKYGFYLGRGP